MSESGPENSRESGVSAPPSISDHDNTNNENKPNKPIRIALFTVMGFAIRTAVCQVIDHRSDVELALVITCTGPKSRRSDAHKEVLDALWETGHYNTTVVVSNQKSKYADLMKLYQIDLIMSIGYPWLLPRDILQPYPGAPRLGAVNFHNSLLPQYRGPNAFGWALCNGDSEIGFCSHRMDGEFDTGAVLVTQTLPNEINDTVHDMFPKISPLFVDMVATSLDKMLAGDPGTPQTGSISQAPKFPDEFRWMEFSDSRALELHNKVRSYYGARDIPHGALATLRLPVEHNNDSNDNKNDESKDVIYCITRTFYDAKSPEQAPRRLDSPGQTCWVTENDHSTFFVQCRDIPLKVLEWHKYDVDKED